jgi:hypothetical protein
MCSLDEKDPLSKGIVKVGYSRKIDGHYFLVNDGRPLPDILTESFFYLEGSRI